MNETKPKYVERNIKLVVDFWIRAPEAEGITDDQETVIRDALYTYLQAGCQLTVGDIAKALPSFQWKHNIEGAEMREPSKSRIIISEN